MKKLIPILLCALLFGCSTKTPTEFAMETGSSGTEQATVNACLAWVQAKEQQELAKFDTLAGQDRAMALMHRDTMGMIKNVWGKQECQPGTNQWDAYIAYVQETEKSHRQYASDIKSVATVGIVTTGVVKLADSLMGAAGDRINTSGDNSGVTKTTTTTTSDTKSSNVGEGSSSASGGTGATADKKESGSTGTVSATHWNECVTTTGGARPSVDEINGCMIGYGYDTTVVDGQLQLDGKPYNGPAL